MDFFNCRIETVLINQPRGFASSANQPTMKKIMLFLALTGSITCYGQNRNNPAPEEIIDEITGDLDNDGIDEKILVINTSDTSDHGRIRVICIRKLENNEWKTWVESKNAILESEAGGMMGDPYQGITVENGILKIYHFGGSSWKWSVTDKYRLENDEFKLIGYTSIYGRPCDYWKNIDYNLSTGKVVYDMEYESCEEEEQRIYRTDKEVFLRKGLNISLTDRNSMEVRIISPKHKYEFSL